MWLVIILLYWLIYILKAFTYVRVCVCICTLTHVHTIRYIMPVFLFADKVLVVISEQNIMWYQEHNIYYRIFYGKISFYFYPFVIKDLFQESILQRMWRRPLLPKSHPLPSQAHLLHDDPCLDHGHSLLLLVPISCLSPISIPLIQ